MCSEDNCCVNWLRSTDTKEPVRGRIFIALKLILWFCLICLIILSVILQASCYKSYDIVSALKTKVTGNVLYSKHAHIRDNFTKYYHNVMHVWSNAEYLTPSVQGELFIPTNAIITENQTLTYGQSRKCCIKPSNTTQSNECVKRTSIIHDTGVVEGVFTGYCVRNTNDAKCEDVCQTYGWIPPEKERLEHPHDKKPLIAGLENLTIFINNTIHFVSQPDSISKTNVMKGHNIIGIKLPNCTYDKQNNPFCPVFTLGWIVKTVHKNYSQVVIKGAAIRIDIKWDCYLDTKQDCKPDYDFGIIEDSEWYKKKYVYSNDTYRTALKLYGIQIVIRVSGIGRGLDGWECTKHIGSLLSYFGFAGIVTGCVAWVILNKERNAKAKSDSNKNNSNSSNGQQSAQAALDQQEEGAGRYQSNAIHRDGNDSGSNNEHQSHNIVPEVHSEEYTNNVTNPY